MFGERSRFCGWRLFGGSKLREALQPFRAFLMVWEIRSGNRDSNIFSKLGFLRCGKSVWIRKKFPNRAKMTWNSSAKLGNKIFPESRPARVRCARTFREIGSNVTWSTTATRTVQGWCSSRAPRASVCWVAILVAVRCQSLVWQVLRHNTDLQEHIAHGGVVIFYRLSWAMPRLLPQSYFLLLSTCRFRRIAACDSSMCSRQMIGSR